MYDTVIGFFQNGGWFMYPIVLVLAIGVAIIIERSLFLLKAKRENQQFWEAASTAIERGMMMELSKMCSRSSAAISHVLKRGLQRLERNGNEQQVASALEEGLMDVLPRFEKRTPYLATFANMATLLGLLGTIIGLIQAFTAVAHADPAQKADLLSSSISVAMNTTAFGLMVAIPMLMAHSWLQARTTETVDALEAAAVKFVNNLGSRS